MSKEFNISILLIAILSVFVSIYYYRGLYSLEQGTIPATVSARTGDKNSDRKSPPEIQGNPAPSYKSQMHADQNIHFTHFRVGPRNIKTIFIDEDIVWVGTSGGVIRYDTNTDKHIILNVDSGLLSNGIFHISRINGRLAVGTYGGGLAFYNPQDEKQWDIYNVPEGLADAFVYDVLKTDNNDIWIATWSVVNRVRGGKLDDPTMWETLTVKNTGGGLPNDWVYALAKGKDGTIWMATEGGLAEFTDGKWRNWQHEDGLGAPYEEVRDQIEFKSDPAKISEHHARQKKEYGLENVDVAYNPNYIVALMVDEDGIVWCGTWGGGLARFDNGQWTNYTVKDGLPSNHVYMLHQDKKGRIWIGTSNGLARKNGETFSVYTTSEGLVSNAVFSMDSATDGTMWIGSFGGVSRILKLPHN